MPSMTSTIPSTPTKIIIQYKLIRSEVQDYLEVLQSYYGLEEDVLLNLMLSYWNQVEQGDPTPLIYFDGEKLKDFLCDWVLQNVPSWITYGDPEKVLAPLYEGIEQLYREFHPTLYHLYRQIRPVPQLAFVNTTDHFTTKGLFTHAGHIPLVNMRRTSFD